MRKNHGNLPGILEKFNYRYLLFLIITPCDLIMVPRAESLSLLKEMHFHKVRVTRFFYLEDTGECGYDPDTKIPGAILYRIDHHGSGRMSMLQPISSERSLTETRIQEQLSGRGGTAGEIR
jgi:hypothetical protein